MGARNHTHTTSEQHFILEGGYETGGWELGQGTYHYLPARQLHGPLQVSCPAI